MNKSYCCDTTTNHSIIPEFDHIHFTNFITNLIREAIVTWCHENSGRSMTLNNLRKNCLRVISTNSEVQRTIFRCVTCRKLPGAFGCQNMEDLPKDRSTEAPPFTNCGVDMFGPFFIPERRSDL